MKKARPGTNPYDFRSPVRRQALLAGRDDELAQIDEFLRESASGRPVHFSLFGGQGSGKSSLLNGVVDLARNRGFLPVKPALRETVVETELDFYRAMYDAALQALVDLDRLDEGDPVLRTWGLRTCTGQLPGTAEPQELELGLLVAAKLNGRMVGDVPTPLVKRDLQRLLSFGGEPLRGLVLCLDGAHFLDRNSDLAPSLLQLADATPLLTIVTSAEAAGSVHAAAPRAWAQIEVGPFGDLGDVLDAITKPVHDSGETLGLNAPTPATAVDILHLTGGVPYEVNLVCHFIWDAVQQGEQDSFELSPAVIERVIAELEEKGRHQASPEVATFSALSAPDLRSLGAIAPYEALTVRQLALVRLMLDDYGEADLEAAEAAVHDELADLERKGLVHVERDRFQVHGGRDARLYLRYAVQRLTDRKLRYGRSYPKAVTARCATELGRVVAHESYEDARIFRRGRPHEVGGSVAGRWLDGLVGAADEKDIVGLSHVLGGWITPNDVLERRDATFVLLGLQLQVAVHDVEHVELIANVDGDSLDDIREAAERWVTENDDLLKKYDVQDVAVRCVEVPFDLLAAALAYSLLGIMCQISFIMYRDGANEAAEEALGATLKSSEDLVGSDPADPLVRTQLGKALHRRGFMAATRADWDVALERLEHSATMAITDGWLLDYNRAYVVASQGRFDDAVRLVETALQHIESHHDLVLLHAYLPTPDGWDIPGEHWNDVELQGRWIEHFLTLQLHVLRASASAEARTDLEAALEDLGPSAPLPLLRLGGWARLTLLDQPQEAAELFNRAVVAAPYDQADIPTLEATFAESLASEALAGGGGSSVGS